jgi:hypothetical protein
LARRGDARIDLTKRDPTSGIRSLLLTTSSEEVVKGEDNRWRIPGALAPFVGP